MPPESLPKRSTPHSVGHDRQSKNIILHNITKKTVIENCPPYPPRKPGTRLPCGLAEDPCICVGNPFAWQLSARADGPSTARARRDDEVRRKNGELRLRKTTERLPGRVKAEGHQPKKVRTRWGIRIYWSSKQRASRPWQEGRQNRGGTAHVQKDPPPAQQRLLRALRKRERDENRRIKTGPCAGLCTEPCTDPIHRSYSQNRHRLHPQPRAQALPGPGIGGTPDWSQG